MLFSPDIVMHCSNVLNHHAVATSQCKGVWQMLIKSAKSPYFWHNVSAHINKSLAFKAQLHICDEEQNRYPSLNQVVGIETITT